MLTAEAFEKWLKAQDQDKELAEILPAEGLCLCPLERFWKAVNPTDRISVGAFNYIINGTKFITPAPLDAFVLDVDNRNKTWASLTPAECLDILEQSRAN